MRNYIVIYCDSNKRYRRTSVC